MAHGSHTTRHRTSSWLLLELMATNTTETGIARGAIYLVGASAAFLLSSYAIHFGLGRHLGPPDYGSFGVILTLMSTVNLLVATGLPQAASKHISEGHNDLGSVVRASRRIQITVSLLIFGLYFGMADLIADLLHDPDLSTYIRLSACVIPFYALYSLYCDGFLNGLRRFGQQASASVLSSLAKVVLAFVLVIIGLNVKGAILAYIIAAVVGWLAAWRYFSPVQRTTAAFQWTKLLKFGIPATLLLTMLYFMTSIDLLGVKALIHSNPDTGNPDTGLYTAASTIAKVPYFLLTGLAMVILPSISMSTSTHNTSLTASYINQSVRYMLMLLAPVVVLISATSEALVSLLYSSTYAGAGHSLSILIFGLGFFSIFFVLAHVILGSGKPGIAFAMALPLMALAIALNIVLIPRYGLPGAAWATTITAITGVTIVAAYILRRFKALIGFKSLLKICFASAIVYVIALQVSPSTSFLIPAYVGLLVLYFALLLLMREFDRQDMTALKRLASLGWFGSPRP